MSIFTESELRYLLEERRLARLATVGTDGTPHIAPVGWSYDETLGTIDVSGRDFARTTPVRDPEPPDELSEPDPTEAHEATATSER